MTCGDPSGLTALAVLFLFCKDGVRVRAAAVEAHGNNSSHSTSVQVTEDDVRPQTHIHVHPEEKCLCSEIALS